MTKHESGSAPAPVEHPDQTDAPFEYRMLTGHNRTDGSWKSTEDLQTEYVRLTDELVREVTEGVDVRDKETGEMVKKLVDCVAWLDKSGRPVQWLFHELWPTLAQRQDGTVPTEPQHRFVNIDRNQWTSRIDPEGRGMTKVDDIDPSIIRSLRSIFLADPADRRDGLTGRIDQAPTQFDGKTVLIVDEVLSSGRTLKYATEFFTRAFPEAYIAGSHWMRGMVTKKGATSNADVPVWYSDKTDLGRGVGNRNIDASLSRGGYTKTDPLPRDPADRFPRDGAVYETNPNMNAQRLGAWFLSVGLVQPDPLSRQLRNELHHLAEDVRAGKVFVEPSFRRHEDDFDERALRLNGFESLQQYIAEKRRRTENK